MPMATENPTEIRNRMPFASDPEAVDVLEELERRRKLVQEGKSRLVGEDESWEILRGSGCHV